MVKKSKQILDNKMLVVQCPHMMNQSALRTQLPAVSLYVVHVLFESKVGTLADQLNVICFSNISIISDSYLSNKFGIMSGTLFSLMDSGAVLSRYDDGTEYKGMSACKSRDFCHLGQSTISGGWMKILRLLTLLLFRLRFFPYRTPHGSPAGPAAPTACVPPPPPPPPASSFLRSARPHHRQATATTTTVPTRAPSFAPANSGELSKID